MIPDRTDGPTRQAGEHPLPPRLGLIEYFDFAPDRSRQEKQQYATEAALLADEVGYSRIWLPEHHGPASACANPLLLAAMLGTHVRRARVASAVTLLRVRDPYLTAVEVGDAVGLSPNGFDLGIGRGDFGGPGSEILDHLRKSDRQFTAALDQLLELLDTGSPAIAPLDLPHERWMHGAGGGSAEVAGKLGLNYSHGLFLNPNLDACLQQFETYRSLRPDSGTTAVAMTVLTSDRSAATITDAHRRPVVVNCAGSVEECAQAVVRVQRMTGADEVVIAEVSQDPVAHSRAVKDIYEAVAGLCG
ncbi:LLM class flavin-dependent oxidoreductase [Kitasatospora sp. NPDC018058]|uniref:LLM class flavin-dependent oxidoreductase n=1 Tax=Kitasatospora sp. NPDC018058 TaxID=3364025 RepID=UPI0037C023E6